MTTGEKRRHAADGDHAGIEVFDFFSHGQMHHQFNEAYIRILRSAFPDDPIAYHACAENIENLAPKLAALTGVTFSPCLPFEPPFRLSRHNPIAARVAAWRCLRQMAAFVRARPLRLCAVLGVDANLFAVLATRRPFLSSIPLHMILHSYLGDAMMWRSRNPFIRAGDFVAQLRRRLPSNVRLIALELGVEDAIAAVSDTLPPSLRTLEHPILASEWGPMQRPSVDRVVKIGFVGHSSRTKGFDTFVEIAERCRNPERSFFAVGLRAADSMGLDLGALSSRPSPTPLPRAEYLAAIADLDLVCLPLASRAYDFIASGSVCDAIAALRPVLAMRTRVLDAIFARYGDIGYLADSKEDLFAYVRGLTYEEFIDRREQWVANLARAREARRPEALARGYAAEL